MAVAASISGLRPGDARVAATGHALSEAVSVARTQAQELIAAAAELRDAVARLRFGPPVTHVYNPLDYAWAAHRAYLQRYGSGSPRVLFLGMNPGPFGMVQTGIPFGEVRAVRDWLQIEQPLGTPAAEHPRRPVQGLACPRSEVSGQRLWGLFAERFGEPKRFFDAHFVANYCPLAFLEETGRNRTPDRLPAEEQERLFAACDRHLRRVLHCLRPAWLIGVGSFAAKRAEMAASGTEVQVARILHPSPASPAANRNWAQQVTRQLAGLGVWTKSSRRGP